MRDLKTKKRIVIVGGGFAGINGYLELHRQLHGAKDVEVFLVSEKDYFLFTPMIHEVATGGLLATNVTQALRSLPRCCISRFIEGTAKKVDLINQEIFIKTGDSPAKAELESISYDYLLLALGSDTNFFKTPGAEEYSFRLRNLADALAIKARVINSLNQAEATHDASEQKRLLSFAVVGGGPTGVELAAELADLIKSASSNFPTSTPQARITLIHAGSRLVPQVESWFATRAAAILAKIGVEVRLNTKVLEVRPDEVVLDSGVFQSQTTIWTAGVKARHLDMLSANEIKHEPVTERIAVNQYLQLPEYPQVFLAGDQALICDVVNQAPYPMRAQFAVREGVIAAKNISSLLQKESLRSFAWRDSGFILSLGYGRALARVFGIRWSGPLAWFVYRTAYLFKLFGWRAKFRTALEWTLGLFMPRDISKL